MIFFNDTAATEIYTLSLHDALPISAVMSPLTPDWISSPTEPTSRVTSSAVRFRSSVVRRSTCARVRRSEEHTSELQSRQYLVCRLLLEKKKKMHLPPSFRLINPAVT